MTFLNDPWREVERKAFWAKVTPSAATAQKTPKHEYSKDKRKPASAVG